MSEARDANAFAVGQVIQVTRKTPKMPTPDPKGNLSQILAHLSQMKQITPGEGFEIVEVREVAGRTWYRCATEDGEPEAWVNSAALVGQRLKVLG